MWRPVVSQGHFWSFNSVDAARDGVLSAYVGSEYDDEDGRVVAIDYAGDRDSAPHDLSPLRGLNRTESYAHLGEPLSGDTLGKDALQLR